MLNKKIVAAAVSGILAVGVILTSPMLFENLDAKNILVIQSPLSGELTIHTTPGLKFQGFGKITEYPKQDQYSFCSELTNQNGQWVEALCQDADTGAKQLRFNDGGHAKLSGAVLWEMPTDEKSIREIHTKFGSAKAVQQQAIARMLDGAIYLAGPLMSSTESSGSRRSEMVQYINDQALKGVYVTKSQTFTVKDPISGQDKIENVTTIVMGKNGLPERQQNSLLDEYNIGLQPLAITELKYDNVVEKQIAERQQSITAVQNSKAEAIKAEQAAITVEAEGRAKAAKAKWEQEVIKAQAVTEAQQKYEVATLAAKEAEQFKREQILRGEGEAARKQLVMNADGALDQKLEALVKINAVYADAIAKAQPGAWTPTVMMGASKGAETSGTQQLMEVFAAKAARDLGVDLSVAGKNATAKK